MKTHPLSTIDDYVDYQERSFRGEAGVLTTDEVIFFATTSGTTGKPKRFPQTRNSMKINSDIILASLKKHSEHRRAHGLARRLNLFFVYHQQISPQGVPVANNGKALYKPLPSNVIPNFVQQLTKHHVCTYVTALFALVEPEIGHIEGFCIDLYMSFFNFIIIHQDRLCQDIEEGRVSPFPDIDESVRQDINRYLVPDSTRAATVRDVLQGPVEGLCCRLWPRLKTVRGCRVATFKHTARILLNTYFKVQWSICDYIDSQKCYMNKLKKI